MCCADVAPAPESRIVHRAVYNCSSVILRKFKKPSCLNTFASLHSELDLFCRVADAFDLKQSLIDNSTIGEVHPAPTIELILLPSWLAIGSWRIKSLSLLKANLRMSSSGNSFLTLLTFKRMTGGSAPSEASTAEDLCTVVECKISEIPMPVGMNMSLAPDRIVPLQRSPVRKIVLIIGCSQGNFSLSSFCLLLKAANAHCFPAGSNPRGSTTSTWGTLSGPSRKTSCSPAASPLSTWGSMGKRSQPEPGLYPQLEISPSKFVSSYTCSTCPLEKPSAAEDEAHRFRKPFRGRVSSHPGSSSSSMSWC